LWRQLQICETSKSLQGVRFIYFLFKLLLYNDDKWSRDQIYNPARRSTIYVHCEIRNLFWNFIQSTFESSIFYLLAILTLYQGFLSATWILFLEL
jgi:hypothetical protein